MTVIGPSAALHARITQVMTAYAELPVVDDPTLVDAPIAGLDGAVTFLELHELRMDDRETPDGGLELAATVRWRDEVTGSAFTMTYQIDLHAPEQPLVTHIGVWRGQGDRDT